VDYGVTSTDVEVNQSTLRAGIDPFSTAPHTAILLPMVSVRTAACVIGSLVLNFGCSVYDPELASNSAGCDSEGSAEPPPRPEMADNAPQDDVPETVYALNDVILDTTQDDPVTFDPLWKTTGFNLDSRCTTVENSLWACDPPGPNPQHATDGLRGVDNAFGPALFPLVDIQYQALESTKKMMDSSYVSYAPTLQEYAAKVVSTGQSALVLRMRRWNGTPNDPSVTVHITQSVYGKPGDGSANVPTYSPGDVPAWEGNDWFWVRSDTFLNGMDSEPKVFDNNAYVRDGVVVLRLPDRAELIFVGPGLGLRVALVQGTGTAVLREDGGLDNVQIGGRWTRTDVIQTAQSVGVCPSNPSLYNLLVTAVDNNSDLRSNQDADGDGAPCDAISFGVSFRRGYPARIAGLVTGAPLPDTCQ